MVLNNNVLDCNVYMTLITFQNGTVAMHDGKVGTEQACCCIKCTLVAADVTAQPSVAVDTDCACDGGTHDGTYAFNGLGLDDELVWLGTTTCDWTGFPSDAQILIEISESCVVTVATYQFPFVSLQGSVLASHLIVNNDGEVVGQVEVPLEDLNGVVQCTATLTFG